MKWPPRHLNHLSVPGDVTSSVKEGPSCPHALSAECPPQIPIMEAWKDSTDGYGAVDRWGPRGWAHWAAPVVRVDRDPQAPAQTRWQADQLPSLWDHKGARLTSVICAISTPSGRMLWATHLEESTGVVSGQFTSVTQSCLTLCDPMHCSTPGLPVHHQLLEFTQTHVH